MLGGLLPWVRDGGISEGLMAWAWQLGSAQPLLLVLSHRVQDPGAWEDSAQSLACLSVFQSL